MVTHTYRWFCQCIRLWYCRPVCQWCQETVIPSVLHLFCWLSRKVCIFLRLYIVSANMFMFWTGLFLRPSNSSDNACVHFVHVLWRRSGTWVQRPTILDAIKSGWIQKGDKGWLQLHGGGYSRKGDQSLQKWLTGSSISQWSPFAYVLLEIWVYLLMYP